MWNHPHISAKLPNGITPNYRTKQRQTTERRLIYHLILCYNYALMSENYKKRVIDTVLADRLEGVGAVLVQGPKWCGKTTTCEQVAKSVLYMGDPQSKKRNLQLAEIDINALLSGKAPRLIDEWQEYPPFWDAVRFRVDHTPGFGHFILTGSVVPPDTSAISHTGTGRISNLQMRTMSLWESGESDGSVSLGELLKTGHLKSCVCRSLSLPQIAYLVCRGGWPTAIEQREHIALRRARDYYEAVISRDISQVDKTPRNPDRVMRLMRSYARLQGTQSNLSAIRLDMAEHDSRTLDADTVYSYINALKKLFVIEDMKAWCPNLRSKAVVRTSDTRYFTDSSIAATALGAGPGDLMNDLRTFGFLFETMAVRDLRVYMDAHEGQVSHYMDKNGLECDAIVHLNNGTYGLIEIKLGGDSLIEEGAVTLNKLAQIVDPIKMKPPSFKMVLVAVGEFAYRRKEDDVIVCPITALKP